MFISLKKDNFEEVEEALNHVFGIHEYDIAYKFNDKNFDKIANFVLKLVKQKVFNTFKVVTKRSDKNYPISSMDFSRQIGAVILKNIEGVKVDIHEPELLVSIEIRMDAVYIYFNSEKGIGGYPVGVAGKGLLMLSGGIDSPVAGYMAIKRGVKLECIYFESPPHTSIEAKNKVLELASKLALYNNDIKVHIIRFTDIQQAIYQNCPHAYLITIMRRMMYRIAERIARMNNCKILVNGESIGQVASQTLTSMNVINETVRIPVIRPVACFDKLEIIDFAKKIGTYETSILPYEDCCTIFVPEHPVINPTFEEAREYEKNIDYEKMIYEAIKNHEVIKISLKEKVKEFEDIL
ncbi:MAG TPA: tRNA 4-thiouridine(8) synthase ThiI, partial [Candidatus Coprovivens excrementavium]|nr:tRNA 4-thiouridine(8) synthase ThiI [Candidatus Coprovivens excrementavium]